MYLLCERKSVAMHGGGAVGGVYPGAVRIIECFSNTSFRRFYFDGRDAYMYYLHVGT